MKTYQTKTGVVLTLIQGGGQGDGVPSGLLRLVTQDDTTQTEIKAIHASMKSLYEMAVAKLSLSQYEKVMGGGMSFESKAKRVMRVSKNKTVQLYCLQILELAQELNRIKAA